MKNLLIIHDVGDSWRITGTTQRGDDFPAPKNMYQEVNREEMVKIEKLLEDSILTYPKDQYFFMDKIIKTPEDRTILAKSNALGTLRKKFEDKFSVFDYFNFFKFVILNTDLNTLGYNLNYSQKNELEEIISKEPNSDTAKKIRDYFDVLDKIETNMEEYDKTIKAIEKIHNAQNKEEIKAILNEF